MISMRVGIFVCAISVSMSQTVVAAGWETVSGDELKAAMTNKTWKSVDFTAQYRADGKRRVNTKRGGMWTETFWVEDDGFTMCFDHSKRGIRCGRLEKNGDSYRVVNIKGDKNQGKKWKVKIEDGVDF